MVQANNKPLVMLIGTLGTGKSFLGNKALGEGTFVSKNSFKGCTQNFTAIEGPDFKFMDTPGLNDNRMTLETWLERYRESAVGGSALDLVILVVESKIRVEVQDVSNMQQVINIARGVEAKNIAYVITKCDSVEKSESEKL